MIRYLQVLLIGLSLYSLDARAQDVSLPLGPFRDFLIARYPGCFVNTNGQGELMINTACTAITTEDSLEFHNLFPGSFPVDLTGLQYFTSLVYLDCSDNLIDNFVYPPNLKYLDCSNSLADAPFGAFPTFPTSLETLIASGNSARGTGIPFTANLKFIDVRGNYMTSLPALPAGLQTLICSGQGEPSAGRLTSLPALPSTLQYLDCSDNEISNLPVLPASMKTLICANNRRWVSPEDYEPVLSALPALPSSLEFLDCSDNRISVLPTLPSSLTSLNCGGQRHFLGDIYVSPINPNQLFSVGISVLPALPDALVVLLCDQNNLTDLPSPLPSQLEYLSCSENVYTWGAAIPPAGIRCIPRLPQSINFLEVGGTLVNCLPNSGNYSVVPALPLCNPFNNANQCVSSPVISGNVFYDNNSNGIKDPGENYRRNVRVSLSNGFQSYSNAQGYYEFSADLGSFTVGISNPVNYNAVPNNISHLVSRYDTLINDQVALQPTSLFDSIRINIIPVTAMRPGFLFRYEVNYENIGTTSISPQINLPFSASVLTFQNASNPSVLLSGNSLQLNEPLMSPGTAKRFWAEFIVSTSAILGDTVRATVQATYGAGLSADSAYSVVTGSFDPNDKQATPSMKVSEVVAGRFIKYLIRFQNTGTDTAFNVVIADALDTQLDLSSFELLSTSHLCKTKRNGRHLLFEFINIQLPDSNVNEPASHGHILFRIRPQVTLPANSVVSNRASIYFDFNAPIVTNNALTNIQLNPVPLRLLSFNGYLRPGFRQAMLSWETANEENSSHFVLQRSDDGRGYTDLALIPAMGSGNHSYSYKDMILKSVQFYRLRIYDKDGHINLSPVIRLFENNPVDAIRLISNPVYDDLRYILLNETLSGKNAQLFDAMGNLVHTFILRNGPGVTDISHLPDGYYLLKAGDQVIRLVKRRN